MNMISKSNFVSGIGMGFVAGSAVGMLISPRTRAHNGKSGAGRFLRSMGDVIDSVGCVVGDMLK